LLRSVRVRLGLGAVLRGLLAELLHVVRVEGLRVPLVTLLLVRLFALLGRVLDLIGHLAASWASGTRHRGGSAPTVVVFWRLCAIHSRARALSDARVFSLRRLALST